VSRHNAGHLGHPDPAVHRLRFYASATDVSVGRMFPCRPFIPGLMAGTMLDADHLRPLARVKKLPQGEWRGWGGGSLPRGVKQAGRLMCIIIILGGNLLAVFSPFTPH